ncbi:MAG TPA: glycosyltransferase family 61 protein [Flavisolibacter sp.]|jgi:hypothetical protein
MDRRYRNGIHEPEGQLQILKEEQGAAFWYTPPRFLYDDSVDRVLINGKDRYLDAGLFVEPKRVAYSMNYVGTIGNTGIVYAPELRTAISETAIGYQEKASDAGYLCQSIRTLPPVYFKGVSLCIAKLASEGYFHFLHEAMLKLVFCKEWIDKVDHVTISGEAYPPIVAWLNYAGVPTEKIRFTDGLTNYHYEQLIFTTDLVTDMQPSPWSVKALRNTFPPMESKKPFRWIWASRNDSSSRNVAGEDAILKAFPKFEKVVFSQLTPGDVVQLMHECVLFCGPHGAAFSNIVFQQQGTSVIELYPESDHFFRPVYSRLANVCELNHVHVKANLQVEAGMINKIGDALKFLNLD